MGLCARGARLRIPASWPIRAVKPGTEQRAALPGLKCLPLARLQELARMTAPCRTVDKRVWDRLHPYDDD